MLEKGLKFAQQRNEELDNLRFQIQVLSQNLQASDGQSKDSLDKLLMDYNNWMYPHMDIERKDFVRDSMEVFNKLKDRHKDLKLKEKPIDKNETFKVNIGK